MSMPSSGKSALSHLFPLLTLWENIFGFLLWQYHVLLSNPGTAEEARADLNMLKDDAFMGRTLLLALYSPPI